MDDAERENPPIPSPTRGAFHAEALDVGEPEEDPAFREAVMRALIGEKHPIMFPRTQSRFPFNMFALLLGSAYYAYRKMFKLSLMWLAITIALNLLEYAVRSNCTTWEQVNVVSAVFMGLLLLVNVLQGVLFYRFYGDDLQKRYERFRDACPRDAVGRYAALRVLERRGRPTSTANVLMLLALAIAASFFLGVLGQASVSQLVRGMG